MLLKFFNSLFNVDDRLFPFCLCLSDFLIYETDHFGIGLLAIVRVTGGDLLDYRHEVIFRERGYKCFPNRISSLLYNVDSFKYLRQSQIQQLVFYRGQVNCSNTYILA